MKAKTAAANAEESTPMITTAWVITAIVALLSIQPALNLLSPGQVMNTSFDPLELVNTYGAFGTVGKERPNVIFEATMDDTTGGKANWKPYIYKGLPVLLDKTPPQMAPYQPRLDWQMWFASMASPDEYTWTYNLVWKLLHNDPDITGLFARTPFPGKPPRYVRAVLYCYAFAKPGNPQHMVWTREKLGDWIPALSVNDSRLVKYMQRQGWVK